MTIYILFGEMGAGKNYIGEQLAQHLGCPFYDGDDVFPPKLKEKIKACKSLTRKEVRHYVISSLLPAIVGWNMNQENIVVAQALYIQEHRSFIDWTMLPITWVYVKPPSFFAHMRRLFSRKNGLKWMLLGLMSKSAFQEPAPYTLTITNVEGLDISSIWPC